MRSLPRFPRRFLAAVITLTFISGCTASIPLVGRLGHPKNPPAAKLEGTWNMRAPDGTPNSSQASNQLSWKKVRPSDPEFSVDHPRVNDFVETFETRSRNFFQNALDRSGKYLPEITAILREEGMPTELAYLPIIESGFRPEAVSRAGAVGPWQFIRETGRRYGLRIDRYVDERRDPVKSTRAAAHYLRDLYEMFGSWHLSLAAYNTGEFRVARMLDKSGSDNFWDMADGGYLVPETQNYVPQFLAALEIARSPGDYGFEPPDLQPLRYDNVKVKRSLPLRAVAKLAGVSVKEIKELNPQLLRGVTPPDPGGYRVRVPEGTKEQFVVAYAEMIREARDAEPAMIASTEGRYKIRRGDSPSGIAKRFGISVHALMRANHWKSARSIRAGTYAHIPGGGTAVAEAAPRRRRRIAHAAPTTIYRVRRGDTAWSIARRFGTSVQTLIKLNGWKNPRSIRHGIDVRVPADNPAA